MRTKHLLMTMALPLAFAACTSDEFESFDQGDSLKNRKEIGQVALAFDNGDALTRWTAGMQPEVNDRVGAVLIDDLTSTEYNEKDPISNYTPSETQIYSNYMYENDGNDVWYTNANLVEGGYYFYAPYVAHQGRGLMKLETPVVQTLDVENGKIVGNSAIVNFIESESTPFYIGYKFLSAAESNVNVVVKMRHIFAYPRFVFKNATDEEITLDRIMIQSEGNLLVESGYLYNPNIGGKSGNLYITGEQTDEAIAAEVAKKDETDAPFKTWGTWSQVFSENKIPDGLKTEDLLNNDTKKTSVIRIDLEEPVKVAKGETVSFGVVMPAAQFADKKLKIHYVTTDDEAYTWENDGQVTTMLGDANVAEDYNDNGGLKGADPKFSFDAKEVNKDFNLINLVTSTQELINVIDENQSSTKDLIITLAGEDIEFNKDVMTAVSRLKTQSLKLNGIISIVGGETEEEVLDIDHKVLFGEVVVKKGYTKFNNSSLTYESVKVEEDATLNIASKGITGDAVITNYGNLEVATNVNNVKNYGNVEVLEKGNVTFIPVKDEDAKTTTVTYNEKAEVTISGEINYNIVNNGKLTIADNTVLEAGLTNEDEITMAGTATNNGTLTNNGTIYGTQTLTNAGTVNNNYYIQCAITNAKVNKAATGETQKVYTINANEGAKFVGNLSGTAGSDKEYSIINVEDKASIEEVDGDNVSVKYAISTLVEGEETVLPTNNAGEAIINTLDVTNVSINKNFTFGKNSSNSADGWEKGYYPSFGAVETLNVTGNINIGKSVTVTLPAGATVNIKGNSTLTDGKLTWNAGTPNAAPATVNIVNEYTFTNRGTVAGATDGVTFALTGTAKGGINNLGTVENSTNIGDESWWKGANPKATAMTASTSLTRGGIYSVESRSNVAIEAMTKEDVVKFVEGTASSISISKADVKDLASIGKVIVGSKVTLNLGTTEDGFEWADSEEAATVPTNIVGETGSHVVVTYSSQLSKTYDWNGSAWVKQEAGI